MRQDTDRSENGHHDESAASRETTGHRYTVHEAALLLGLSVDAVRKRAERGTLKREKAPDGTVYIVLDIDHAVTSHEEDTASRRGTTDEPAASQGALVTSLQDQIDYLRSEMDIRNEELRRKDHLLAAALERIPELDAPKGTSGATNEPPEAREPGERTEASEGGGDDSPSGTQEPPRKRSGLYRFFFGP